MAGQVRERVERGLRKTEGMEREDGIFFFKKKQKHRAMLAGDGRVRRKEWEVVLRGGLDVRGLGNMGPSNMLV